MSRYCMRLTFLFILGRQGDAFIFTGRFEGTVREEKDTEVKDQSLFAVQELHGKLTAEI